MKINFKNLLLFWLGLSLMFLAYSIVKLSNSLVSVNRNIPEIINQVSLVNQRIDTITTKSIPDILHIIPSVTNGIDSIQTKIPFILTETNGLRSTTIPNILQEFGLVRAQIPGVLERMDSINRQVPKVINTIDRTTLAINESLLRVDSINAQIPEIMLAVNTISDSISSYMGQAHIVVANADKVANKAARDASMGFIGGILSSPFDAAIEIGNFVIGEKSTLTDEDALVAEQQVILFLDQNSDDNRQEWTSDQINKSGEIQVLRSSQKKGRKIKKIKISFDNSDESIVALFFKDDYGKWHFWK
ncbi:hypothetical protein [Maribacter sp. 2307UL18-2]|uniref:hypothetical protein n=1 Tax=Maribacter sp. 2307UL18-2 TaxID=3386274 RepID=UPI0039BC4D2C